MIDNNDPTNAAPIFRKLQRPLRTGLKFICALRFGWVGRIFRSSLFSEEVGAGQRCQLPWANSA